MNRTYPTDQMEPISDDWLRAADFKWHQFDRQPSKQWVLWIGGAVHGHSSDELGIEVAEIGRDGEWFCWIRSDFAGRYSRMLHVRHVKTRGEIMLLFEGLTNVAWNTANHFFGQVWTPEAAARHREETNRIDRRIAASRDQNIGRHKGGDDADEAFNTGASERRLP